MQNLLHAGFVSIDETQDTLIVGFADRQFDTSRYFMLQRARNPDDDAGVYLERDSQGCSVYGIVLQCVLFHGRVEMTVDAATAKSLGTEVTFAIEFPQDQALSRRLHQGLEKVLAGTSCTVKTSDSGSRCE
jgi:hypothetical protein